MAKAQFFPQISLTGSGGGAFERSSAFSNLMSPQLGIWSYGVQVIQPVFTGGALTGNLRLAKSENQQALIAYWQTIQRAFGDVSDALIGYQKFHHVRVRQEDTVADLQESVRLERQQVRHAIEQLPLEFREIILLREYEELSNEEIAVTLQCPVGTVMSRLARAVPNFAICFWLPLWPRRERRAPTTQSRPSVRLGNSDRSTTPVEAMPELDLVAKLGNIFMRLG